MDGNVQGNAPDGRNAFRKGFDYLRSRGLKEFGARAVEKVRDARFDYDAWVRRQEPSPSLVGYQKNLWMKRSPVLSVILTSPEAGSMEEAAHRDLQEGRAARDRAATIASVQASTHGKYQFTDTLNSQISDDETGRMPYTRMRILTGRSRQDPEGRILTAAKSSAVRFSSRTTVRNICAP